MVSQSPAPHDRLIGHTLKGSYRIRRLIATGGMGGVYEAEHLRLRRPVAVKVLLEHAVADKELVERFYREVEIIAQLGHPHIVQVVDVDQTAGGQPYLVMEFLHGETLEDRLNRDHHLPVDEAVEVVSQVASALAEVHSHRIIHRDLKPANIYLVRAAGEPIFVKVLDFGISKANRDNHKITEAKRIIGTPNYMAPEQARAERQDHRTDQFALAAIAYEALAGAEAFPGEGVVQVLHRVLNEEPAPLSQKAPWLPAVFDSVISRALEKDPEARFSSVSRFAFALQNASERAGFDRKSRISEPPSSPANEALKGSSSDTPTVQRARPPSAGAYSVRPKMDASEPVRYSSAPRRISSQPPSNASATQIVTRARHHLDRSELDEAVRAGEQLLELAVYQGDPAVRKVVASAVPLLDRIFDRRVGSRMTVLRPGPAAGRVRELNLSPRAAELLSFVERPMAVREILEAARFSPRDGIRILAGLLRRGILVKDDGR